MINVGVESHTHLWQHHTSSPLILVQIHYLRGTMWVLIHRYRRATDANNQKQNNMWGTSSLIWTHTRLLFFDAFISQTGLLIERRLTIKVSLNLETRRETGFFYEVPNGGGASLSEDSEKKPRQDRKTSNFNRITCSMRSPARVGERQEELACY